MSFAERLHRQRVAKAMSLQDVATAVGMSKAHVWNLEKGLTDNPSLDVVKKLAGLFRVRIADLVGESPEAPEEEPEMVALFRDLKKLEPRDRETIRVLMEQLRRSQGDKGQPAT